MDAFDRFWQWADKSPESSLRIRPSYIGPLWSLPLRTDETGPR